MTQEQMLSLILDKVGNIESDVSNLKKDIKEVKSAQNNIKEYIMNTEKAMIAYDEDHKMLQRIKVAVNG